MLFIQVNKSDPKGLWKKNQLFFHCIPLIVLPKDVSHSSIANRLSTFFLEKIHKIRSVFSNLWSPEKKMFRGVSTDDVRKIMFGSPTKSCIRDTWPTFLVKDYIDILIQPITSIVNLALSEGVVIDKVSMCCGDSTNQKTCVLS